MVAGFEPGIGSSSLQMLRSEYVIRQVQLQRGTRSTLAEPGYPGCSCDFIWTHESLTINRND